MASSIPYLAEIKAAAKKYRLDPALLAGLIKQESGFNPRIGSPAGALGLTQLMPGTAAELGVTDRTNPRQSIDGGAKYLRQQLDTFGGDTTKALAAYNAGPYAVKKAGGVPPYAETQNYVKVVQANADAYRAGGLKGSGADFAGASSSGSGTSEGGGGILQPVIDNAVRGLLWIALILGGAGLALLGLGRTAGAAKGATA